MIKDNWKLILFVLTTVTTAATATGYFQAKKEIIEIHEKYLKEDNEIRVELAVLQHRCKFSLCPGE